MEEIEYLKLLYRHYDSQIELEELEQLKKWQNASQESQRIAYLFDMAWQESLNLRSSVPIDLDNEFFQLKRRIEAQTEPVIPHKKWYKTPVNWYGFAASILFLVAVAIVIKLIINLNTKPNWVEVVTGEQSKQIMLEDGSEVYLEGNSALSYPTKFSENERLLYLTGEASFKVIHQEQRPFVVEAIDRHRPLRRHHQETTVNVLEGSCQFRTQNTADAPWINQGEKGIYDFEKGGFTVVNIQKSCVKFIDTPLAQVIEHLEVTYQIDIELDRQVLRTCLLTMSVCQDHKKEALQVISIIFDLEVVQKSNKVFQLKGGSCK
ncbi:MAG: FecR family protein [Flammeovirgaceae bacterium]